MKISDLISRPDITPLTNIPDPMREIKDGYIGDLLSWVMGRAKPQDVWITIMNNINIVAVATLTDVSAIILCEGVVPGADVIEKANEEEVVILKSEKTAYQLAKELGGEIE